MLGKKLPIIDFLPDRYRRAYTSDLTLAFFINDVFIQYGHTTMNKYQIVTLALVALNSTAYAQNEVVIPKDEFVANQLQMMEQVKEAQAAQADEANDPLKAELSPEEYEKYKKEAEQEKTAQEAKMAGCLGIPADRIPALTEKMGADFQISVIKTCSKDLPDQVNVGAPDMMESPAFKPYMACAEGMVADEIGVSAEKLKSCTASMQEGS